MKFSFVRNMSTIFASSVATQGAMLAVTPILTRLFEPDAFGIFATFSAIHAILLILFSLKYDIAIILPTEDEEARKILALTVYLPAFFSTMLFAGLLLVSMWTDAVKWYMFLLPASVTFASCYSAFQQWGARQRDYRHYAISQIVNTGFNLALCVIFGVAMTGLKEGLLLAFLGGLLAGALYISWATRAVFDRRRHGSWFVSPTKLRDVARKYARMPLQVLPFTVFVVIAQSATPLILDAHFPLADVGLFAVASRVLLAPVSILGSAIGEPFRAELAARMRNGDQLASFARKTIAMLVALGACAFAIFYVLSPWLFGFVFGGDYAEAGMIARAICLGAFGQFIVLPTTYAFVITGHLRTGMFAQAAVAFFPAVTLYAASAHWSMELSLYSWSVVMFLTSLLLVSLVLRSVSSPKPSARLEVSRS